MYFLPNDPLTYPTDYYLYYNTMSSLSDLISYDQLVNNTDSEDTYNRINFQYQLQTSYGLSQNQSIEFTYNFNEMWWQMYNNLTVNYTVSNSTYQNEWGLMYWQWANSTYSEMATGY